jgi:hypothetical protein
MKNNWNAFTFPWPSKFDMWLPNSDLQFEGLEDYLVIVGNAKPPSICPTRYVSKLIECWWSFFVAFLEH